VSAETPRMTPEEVKAMYADIHEHEKLVREMAAAAFANARKDLVLTEKQERVVLAALTGLFSLSALTLAVTPDCEFKTLTLSPGNRPGDVEVVAEVGRKGDEGTAAQAFCRERAQFWVTPRGGLSTVGGNSRVLHGKAAFRYITSFARGGIR
jgi:hypothetical protein